MKLTEKQTEKIFNTITSNGCREMEEVRFHQAVNEALMIANNNNEEPNKDGMMSGVSHSDISEVLSEAYNTIEYMNSLIKELAVSEIETYYNRYANAQNLLMQTKASL